MSEPVPSTHHDHRRVSQISMGDDEIDLLAVFRTLWRGKIWILLFFLISTFAGGYYAYNVATPKFTAKAVVVLESRTEQVVDIESVVSGLAGDQATINTEVEVLRSRGLIEKLVQTMNLTADPEFNTALKEVQNFSVVGLKALVFGPTSRPDRTDQEVLDTTVSAVLRVISVSNVRQSYAFNIFVVTTNAKKSATIANTLSNLYILNQLETKFEATERATSWLSERVGVLRTQLEDAEADLKAFSAETDLVSPELLDALNRQVKDARERRDGIEIALQGYLIRLEDLTVAKASGDIEKMQTIANDAVLSRIFTSQGGGTNFETRFSLVLQRAQQEAERARTQSASLEQSITQLDQDYIRQSSDLVNLQQLQREAEASRLIYEFFLGRLKETSVQAGIQQADSRILSKAAMPINASEPRKSLILVLAAMLGILAGIGFVLVREMIHSGFRTAEEMEHLTGHAVMGQIPKIPSRSRQSVIQYLVEKPMSAQSEAFRNLRTSVLLSNVDSPPKVIMVTSSLPGEGKTTVSIALAQNFVGMGKKVLLLEGDIRRRVFSEYFDLKNKNGLLSVLSGDKKIEEVEQKSEMLGLDIIIGEKSTTNAADIFSSERFHNFIREARDRYDVVIIDTPPVLVVPDARVIAGVVDTILYSVKWDSTSRVQVTEGLRLMESGKVRVSGLILSQIDPKGMKRYGYGNRFGAYSSYGRGYYEQ